MTELSKREKALQQAISDYIQATELYYTKQAEAEKAMASVKAHSQQPVSIPDFDRWERRHRERVQRAHEIQFFADKYSSESLNAAGRLIKCAGADCTIYVGRIESSMGTITAVCITGHHVSLKFEEQ